MVIPSASLAKFRPVESLHDRHDGGGAVVLSSGRVVVVGGRRSASTEQRDPSSGRWTRSADLNVARSKPALVVLPDDRILAIGGSDASLQALRSVEIRDPDRGDWTVAAPMQHERTGHTATLLSNGQVLVVGGGWRESATAEIWDPPSEHWRAAAPMAVARGPHVAIRLQDGRVLVTGGTIEKALPEVWDAVTDRWTPTSLPNLGYHGRAVLLEDGQVVAFGSTEGRDISRAEIWDPRSDRWKLAGELVPAVSNPSVILLPDGQVGLLGGRAVGFRNQAERLQAEREACEKWVPVPAHVTRRTWVWSPSSGTFARGPTLTWARADVMAVALPDARVLVIGGTTERSTDLQTRVEVGRWPTR